MRLSIVMPTLNEAPLIEAALAALQPLRQRGHEVIVADGGSADGTPALAAPLADRVIAVPHGRARQMNAGAAAAAGDALLFLHADTRLPENAAAAIEAALRRRPWGRFDVRIEGRPRLLRLVAALMNLRSRLTGIATGDQAIFATAAAFARAGGYPDLPLMEDIEISRRLKRLGRPACLRERAVTSGRRWESRGPWRTVLLMWRLRFDHWRGVPTQTLAARYRAPSRKPLTRIVVFAKAPVPGRVKTRLAPALGAAGAARLARRMLDHALAQALAAGVGPVELCAAPAVDHADWAGFRPPPGVTASEQGGGDLGARMARAARRCLGRGERMLLIGTDCPSLSAGCLCEAAAALDDHDAALHPAADGGYPLLGLRAFHPTLFEAIPWSTPAVARLTLARMRALGWRVRVGDELADIDEPEDLAQAPPEWISS